MVTNKVNVLRFFCKHEKQILINVEDEFARTLALFTLTCAFLYHDCICNLQTNSLLAGFSTIGKSWDSSLIWVFLAGLPENFDKAMKPFVEGNNLKRKSKPYNCRLKIAIEITVETGKIFNRLKSNSSIFKRSSVSIDCDSFPTWK